MKYTIPEVKLARLRECQVDNPKIETPEEAAAFWRKNITQADWFDGDVETAVALLLNTRRRVTGFFRVSSGTLDTMLIHVREVFKAAIVQGSAAIVLMHNHPSGDPSPSDNDIKSTRDLNRAGAILRIELLDHIIIGDKTGEHKGYASMREMGEII